MVTRRTGQRTARRRSGERGAAMFIVLMVIMILSAIGTFALSNARFEVQASGFLRQHAVSMEATNLGAQAAMAEVAAAPDVYAKYMRTSASTGEVCRANAGLPASPPPPCFHLYALDIENRTGLTTDHLFQRPNAGSPGSLGLDQITGGFWVELTEPLDVIRPIAGAPIDGSPGTPRFLDVTLSSTGTVFIDSNANGVIDWSLGEGQGAVFTSGRAHMLVGPIY
jgi:hypothetical protein